MFVNRLPLIVVFGIELAIGTCDRLRGLVSFEAKISHLMLFGFLVISQTVIAEH